VVFLGICAVIFLLVLLDLRDCRVPKEKITDKNINKYTDIGEGY